MTPKTFLRNILPANVLALKNDVFLLIVHANRIPPHICISVFGKIYSIGAKGHLIGSDLEPFIRTIQRNKIETLFVKLIAPEILTTNQIIETITKITLALPNLEPGTVTCLSPVKNFCKSIYLTETENVRFVFELIPKLENQKVLGQVYHLNMGKYFLKENNFLLNTYGMFEINEAIFRSSSAIVY